MAQTFFVLKISPSSEVKRAFDDRTSIKPSNERDLMSDHVHHTYNIFLKN